MRKLLCLFLLLGCFAYADEIEERREQIIKIINQELAEVSRLSSLEKNRNPDHLLRMAELNLEKAKLYRDRENKDYLSIPAEKRSKVNRRKFFQTSSKYFKQANDLCLRISSNFPNYKSIGEVYYIIAFDAKENNNPVRAKQYFQRALSKTRSGSEVHLKSMISLAELHYNDKEYAKAIPLYENALAKHKDSWWTKDSYNLAWCYYRNNQHSKAIDKMKEVYRASDNDKYVDMKSSVVRDIGQMYATSGKISEGIEFYEKLNINFGDQLISIASLLSKEGRKADAERVLRYAESHVRDDSKKADVYIEQLVHSADFNNYSAHLKATKKLIDLKRKDKLSKEHSKALEFHVQKMGAVLQKKVVSGTYRRTKNNQLYTKWANQYFDYLTELKPDQKSQYIFYQGETCFAAEDFECAMKYYNRAFDQAKTENNRGIMSKSMEGLLAGLGQKGLSQKSKDSYYAPVYENYLSMDSKSKQAEQIYNKLFKVYFDRGDYTKAEELLSRYHKDFPKNHKNKEAMIANLMEVSKKKGDHQKIRQWVQRIDAGEFVVSAGYKLKLQQLLTNIQINEVQTKLEKGQKAEALVGYHKIVEDPHSTEKSKINAKYNLAALYYELGDVNKSFEWSQKAIADMSSQDVLHFADSFLAISSYLFGMQYFEKSAKLSESILQKICALKTPKKDIAFKNSLYLYVAENKLKDAQQVLKLGRSCRINENTLVDATFEIVDKFYEHDMYQVYEQSLENLSLNKKYWPKLIWYYTKLIELHQRHKNNARVRQLKDKRRDMFNWSIANKQSIPVNSLNVMALEQVQRMAPIVNNLNSIRLAFPENVFNQAMKRKLQLLENLTEESIRVQKLGAPEGIAQSYKIIIEAYSDFVEEIKAFKPDGKSADFIASFNKAMNGVVTPLQDRISNFKREAKQAIVKHDILSSVNAEVLYDKHDTNRFYAPYSGVIMHKGGKR